jgi:hypothetical protein
MQDDIRKKSIHELTCDPELRQLMRKPCFFSQDARINGEQFVDEWLVHARLG